MTDIPLSPEDRARSEKLRDEFISMLYETERRRKADVIHWLDCETDFFTAPASTRFHGNYPSGLVEHSIATCLNLRRLSQTFPEAFEGIGNDSIVIAGLLHDVCKANFYAVEMRNTKVYSPDGSKRDAGGHFDWIAKPTYVVRDQNPLGHGEKSVILLQQHITLTPQEIYAIRFHMGGFDSSVKGGDHALTDAYNAFPFAAAVHMADLADAYITNITRESED